MFRSLSVSKLNEYIRGVFEDENVLHNVEVYGEVLEISVRSGHTYLVLTDNEDTIDCVRFNSEDDIKKGSEVALTGDVTFYKKRGAVKFRYNSYRISGAGERNANLAKLKAALKSEGIFDNRPPLPECIFSAAVVTAGTGAAIHDFRRVLFDKAPFVSVDVRDCAMQGTNAVSEIVAALKDLQRSNADVIVLTRGGGADADLNVFNDEAIVRAVSASAIPVLCAVGHEVDFTLSDFAASARAGTPSIAADMLANIALNSVARVSQYIDALRGATCKELSRLKSTVIRAEKQMASAVKLQTSNARHRLKALTTKCSTFTAKASVSAKVRTKDLTKRSKSAIFNLYNGCNDRFRSAAALLDALSPLKTLSKGYAKLTSGGSEIVSVNALTVGDSFDARLVDGKISAIVTDKKECL